MLAKTLPIEMMIGYEIAWDVDDLDDVTDDESTGWKGQINLGKMEVTWPGISNTKSRDGFNI